VLQKLRLLIEGRHEVVTTGFQGWSGLKSGALLTAAEEAGFDLSSRPIKNSATSKTLPTVK